MKFSEHLTAHVTPEWHKQYIMYEVSCYFNMLFSRSVTEHKLIPMIVGDPLPPDHHNFYRATAMLSAVHAVVVCLSVCVCVCVTLRYCIITAKRRIMQITPHDSPLTLGF